MDQLTWFDRTGTDTEPLGPLGRYIQPRISPDVTRLAYASIDPDSGNRTIWLMDLATDRSTRFTSNPANDWYPVWSPDGAQIVFASDRTVPASLYRKRTDGSPEEEFLFRPPDKGSAWVTDWSPDGSSLGFSREIGTKPTMMWLLPLSGSETPAIPVCLRA